MHKVTLLNPRRIKEVVLCSCLVSHKQSGCPPDPTGTGFMGGLAVAFAGTELIRLPARAAWAGQALLFDLIWLTSQTVSPSEVTQGIPIHETALTISSSHRHRRPSLLRKSGRLPCLCPEPPFSYPVRLELMRKFKPMASEIHYLWNTDKRGKTASKTSEEPPSAGVWVSRCGAGTAPAARDLLPCHRSRSRPPAPGECWAELRSSTGCGSWCSLARNFGSVYLRIRELCCRGSDSVGSAFCQQKDKFLFHLFRTWTKPAQRSFVPSPWFRAEQLCTVVQ